MTGNIIQIAFMMNYLEAKPKKKANLFLKDLKKFLKYIFFFWKFVKKNFFVY